MAIDTKNPVFTNRLSEWKLYDDLSGGTKSMRKAGELYLPKEEKESTKSYENRTSRTVLFNGFKRTIRTLSSRPFIIPVQGDDLDEDEKIWFNNIDRQGMNTSQFAKLMLTQALKKNFCVVLVDHPVLDEALDLKTTRENDVRGYPVILNNEDLIDFEYGQDEAADKLTQLRYYENYEEAIDGDQWTKETQRQIRVWTREEIQVYRAPTSSGANASVGDEPPVADWKLHSETQNTLGEIPVEIFYQDKIGEFDSDNNMNDLAWINVNHWQNSSDQQNILHVARVPILHWMGFTKGNEFVVGASSFVKSTSSESKLEFVEHSGAAIASGATEIETIEDRMAVMGADMLVKRTASKTATEKLLNEEAETSELGQMVIDLENILARIFNWIKAWQDSESNAKFSIFKDFAINVDSADLQVLLQTRLSGEMTRETYLSELKRRGVLDDTVNTEDEALKAGLDDQEPFSE